MSIRLLPLLLLAATAAALPAQDRGRRDRDRDREWTSRIDTTVALARGGTVELSLVSGEIVVTGWDRSEARIRAVSEDGRLEFTPSPSHVELRVRSRDGRVGETRYEVTVPRGTRVIANAVSGDVALRGVRGEVEARTVSGNVQIDEASDRISFGTVSGNVRASRLAGTVHGNSVSGDIRLDRVTGDVGVGSVSGEIVLDGISSRWVKTSTTSGDVSYTGGFASDGRYDFRSHSGDVRLLVPADVGARLRVESFSGEVESEFPMTLQPGAGSVRGRPRRMELQLGAGGAPVDVETFSGDIIIRRIGRADDRRN